MSKIQVFVALLVFAGFVSASCPENSTQATYTGEEICFCNTGYWAAKDETCKKCEGSSFSPQGMTNNGPYSNLSSCNICVAGYYIQTPADSTSTNFASDICSPCPANSTSILSTFTTSIANCSCYDTNAIALSFSQTTCVFKTGSGSVTTTKDAASGCMLSSSSSSILPAFVALALLVLLI